MISSWLEVCWTSRRLGIDLFEVSLIGITRWKKMLLLENTPSFRYVFIKDWSVCLLIQTTSVISAFQIFAHAQPHFATEFFFPRIQFGAILIHAPRKWNRKSERMKKSKITWILMIFIIFSEILLKKLVISYKKMRIF